MQSTLKAPNTPLDSVKRTKIVATIGPATNSYEQVLAMIKSGANAIRMNFSHGTHDEREQQIAWIRKASEEYAKPVAIIQDLQGPKMRLGDFDGVITVKKGQQLSFKYKSNYVEDGHIPLQYDLSKKVKRGERMNLFDGRIKTTVVSVSAGVIHAKVENEGILIKRKGINLPDTNFSGSVITTKDKKDIAFGATRDIDYVALSFVHTAQDVKDLKRLLRNHSSSAKIIAKIETKEASDQIEDIVKEVDGIMVARGDLASETSPESVPIMQRQIIGLCLQYTKFSIVATQMLASMAEEPEPTRAEVSDVATAVIVGVDAVMLSDETANGKHPIEAVKVMKRIILYTQDNMPLRAEFDYVRQHTPQTAISKAIIGLSKDLKAKAVVAETKSGATALQIASYRIDKPIIAVTSSVRVAQQLTLIYGVKSYVRPDSKMAALKLTNWLQLNRALSKGDIVVSVSGEYPGVVGTTDTIKVRVL